jgi:hypothetical protein
MLCRRAALAYPSRSAGALGRSEGTVGAVMATPPGASARDFSRRDTFAEHEGSKPLSEDRTPMSETPFRKRLLRKLDAVAGEVNAFLAVAAIGLACVDLVGYAAIVGQSHATAFEMARWAAPVDALGAAPIVSPDSFAQ